MNSYTLASPQGAIAYSYENNNEYQRVIYDIYAVYYRNDNQITRNYATSQQIWDILHDYTCGIEPPVDTVSITIFDREYGFSNYDSERFVRLFDALTTNHEILSANAIITMTYDTIARNLKLDYSI